MSAALADYLERQNQVLLSVVEQLGLIVQANVDMAKAARLGEEAPRPVELAVGPALPDGPIGGRSQRTGGTR